MSALYLYDDARARGFEPFALTRPLRELRAGRARARAMGARARCEAPTGIHRRRRICATSTEAGAPSGGGRDSARAPIVANAAASFRSAFEHRTTRDVWTCDGDDRRGARRERRSADARSPTARSARRRCALRAPRASAIGGWWVRRRVGSHPQLVPTARRATSRRSRPSTSTCARLGGSRSSIGTQARLSSSAARTSSRTSCSTRPNGPDPRRRGARARVHAARRSVLHVRRARERARRPCDGVLDRRRCKVSRRDLSNTIFLGHSNKGHDGFVGHSYLGRWVNLGAGTITSNLKNTYGTVRCGRPAACATPGCSSSARCSAIT